MPVQRRRPRPLPRPPAVPPTHLHSPHPPTHLLHRVRLDLGLQRGGERVHQAVERGGQLRGGGARQLGQHRVAQHLDVVVVLWGWGGVWWGRSGVGVGVGCCGRVLEGLGGRRAQGTRGGCCHGSTDAAAEVGLAASVTPSRAPTPHKQALQAHPEPRLEVLDEGGRVQPVGAAVQQLVQAFVGGLGRVGG